MKNTLLTAVMLSGLCLSADGASVISIPNLTADTTGLFAGFTVTRSTVGNTRTLSFTQTGDLDGGTANDTLSFDLIYEAYTGSMFDGTDVTLGASALPNVNNINWHSNSFTTGNTLSLGISNVVYTDGEGDDAAVFTGFTAINPSNYSGSPAGNIDYYVGLAGATTVTGDPTFTADLTSSGTGQLYLTAAGGPVRLRNLDFAFEICPVPEPSSTALFGLAGLGLLARRVRK